MWFLVSHEKDRVLVDVLVGEETNSPASSERTGVVVQPPSQIDRLPCQFLAALPQRSEEQRMLVILKKQLYGGSWEPMLEDLQNRLDGKPYIFKLANRIQDDIERIEQMREFEKEQDVDLADYVVLD